MMASTDQATHVPKRIIICCDGTWQSAVSGLRNSPSNVTRLSRCLARSGVDRDEPARTWQQIVWYDSGVGTTSALGRVVEGTTGSGLEENVIEAYNFVALNYSPGDKVYCFGFSRGAYTARSIAGLISDIGICAPRDLASFPDIWGLYKKDHHDGRFYGCDDWFEWVDGKGAPLDQQPEDLGYKSCNYVWEKRPHGDWAVSPESREVEVVGVFDTVGSLGMPEIQGYKLKLPFWPKDPSFHNVRLNRNIKYAFHALALDEHRDAFSPTLWRLPHNEDIQEEDIREQEEIVEEAAHKWYAVMLDRGVNEETRNAIKKAWNDARNELIRRQEYRKSPSKLLQVWFPGVHINIGGGSSATLENKGDLQEMSNITFAWMLDQIRVHVAINEDTVYKQAAAWQVHINEINKQVDNYKKLLDDQSHETWSQWSKRTTSRAYSSVVDAVKQRSIAALWPEKPDVDRRDYGWGTGTIIDSYTTMYIMNGSEQRTPGAYKSDSHHHPNPEDRHKPLWNTQEMVHPTVGYRMAMTRRPGADEKLEYKPLKLSDDRFVRRRVNGSAGWEYEINGVSLPEYVIRPHEDFGPGAVSFERFVASGASKPMICLEGGAKSPSKYIEELDKDNGIL